MVIAVMGLLAALALYQLGPPAAAPSSASALEFSSSRAMTHVRAIARRSHPVGTSEHTAVRDYIVAELVAAELTPEVQRTTAINPLWNGAFRAGTVENITARLKGASNTRAVLLVGHYDSVPTSLGASDDGAAVGVLLETLRALKAGPALKNDVIFLFTDAEEVGLLGAQAFVGEHAWARDVGLVLNFEARGTSGPSVMFETSDQNGWLIKEFARAVPHPVANSLAYEIYRLLPNNTDLTVFKSAGFSGLNFAYLDGATHYHTQLDNIQEIDERSVQHHGTYALALTRHFSNINLLNARERNAVYFDVLGLFLVNYSSAIVLPITLVLTVLVLGLVVTGLKKGRLTMRGLGLSISVHIINLIIVPAGLALAWILMQVMLSVFGRSAQAAAYQSKLYFMGFAALAIAISYISYAALRQKIRVENFMAGSLCLWVFLLILSSAFMPGVSYLLTWPLLFCLPAFGYLLLRGEGKPSYLLLVVFFFVAVTPGLLLLAPAIYLISIGLNLSSIGIILAILVVVCELLIPHFLALRLGNDRTFAIVVAVVGISVIGVAAFRSTHDIRRPKLDSLFYGLNADSGKAIWASFDGKPDEWTSRVLSTKAQKKAAPEFFATGRAGLPWQADAVPVLLSAPSVTLLADSTKDTLRAVRFRITSTRGAPVISVYLDSVKNIKSVWINGKQIEADAMAAFNQRKGALNIYYYNALLEGIELTLELRSEETLKMRVVDQTYGLPELPDDPLRSRPAGIIPAPVVYNDATVVSKSFPY
jgi:hypothetical protein